MRDPIVEEVRASRMRHAQRCGHDLAAIVRDLQNIQSKCGHRIVRLEPKKINPTRKSTLSLTAGAANEK